MEIPLLHAVAEECRNQALYNIKMFLITIFEDIRQFVNVMYIIEQARKT